MQRNVLLGEMAARVPVLVATSIKQAPVLSKYFYVSQLILQANEPVLSKHLPSVGSGH